MVSSSLNVSLLFLVQCGLIYTKLFFSASSALAPLLPHQGVGWPCSPGTQSRWEAQEGGGSVTRGLTTYCLVKIKATCHTSGRFRDSRVRCSVLAACLLAATPIAVGGQGPYLGIVLGSTPDYQCFCFCYFSSEILALEWSRSWLWFTYDCGLPMTFLDRFTRPRLSFDMEITKGLILAVHSLSEVIRSNTPCSSVLFLCFHAYPQ